MSYRRIAHNEKGFTLLEMLITISLLAMVSLIFYSGFNTLVFQYFKMQKTATQFSDMAMASQRIANVLRGSTDFISVGSNDVTVYAYFYPSNQYVSQVRYYLNAANTALMADVTPMTANPPSGSPVTANKKTYTIIPNYYKATGVNLFTYLDASGNTLSLPVSDQHIIKGMNITLAVPKTDQGAAGSQNMALNVSLRNRKTNL